MGTDATSSPLPACSAALARHYQCLALGASAAGICMCTCCKKTFAPSNELLVACSPHWLANVGADKRNGIKIRRKCRPFGFVGGGCASCNYGKRRWRVTSGYPKCTGNGVRQQEMRGD